MKKGFNASALKTIAIITMVIDHISWGFFDFYSWQGYFLHIIGRLTIPIMCFFIAEGFRKTHDLKRYILRMAVFAAISIVPFYLFFHEEYAYRQNIIFDYLLALLLLAVLESKRFGKPVKVILSALLVMISFVIGGWPIMPMVYVLIFYYADSFKKQAVWFCSSTVGLVLFMMLAITLNSKFNFYPMYSNWVWWDKSYFLGFMLALPLLKRYNGEKGSYPFGRYFFFVFYPAHFLVLFASKEIIKNYGSYWLYVALQIVCIVLVVYFVIRIMLEKSSKAQNAAVLLGVSGLVYVVAFFIETTAPSQALAYGIVTMEYLGEAGGFIGTTIFLSEFCHFRVPKFFYVIEGIVFGGSVVLVHTAEHNHIFYKSISMDYSGDFPRLAVIIRSAGFTGGYEVSFLGIIFMAIFAMLALIKYGYFDSVQQAVTNVIYKSSEGLLVLDNDRYVLYFNSVIKELFPEVSDKRSVNCVPALRDIIGKCFDENGDLGKTRTPNTVRAGDRIFEIKTEPILEAGFVQGYTVRAFDCTAHYHSIEELRRSAHIDALTGLYDREIFKQEITQHLSEGGIGALFMADVDFFKHINDNFGHIVGDEVLVTLSETIRTVFAEDSISCRVGGDEFMMFVKNTNDKAVLAELAEKLNAVYGENVKKAAEGLTSSLSIGIVLSSSISGTEGSEAFETLYGLADKALYQTKENGRNGYSFYEKVMA